MIQDFLEQEIPADWSCWDSQRRQAYHYGGVAYDGPTELRSRVCAAEIWCEVLGRQRGDMRQRDTREINGILESMPGWKNRGVQRAGKPYGMQRCFGREESTD